MCSLFLQTLQTQQAPLEHRPGHSFLFAGGGGWFTLCPGDRAAWCLSPEGEGLLPPHPVCALLREAGGYVSIEENPDL